MVINTFENKVRALICLSALTGVLLFLHAEGVGITPSEAPALKPGMNLKAPKGYGWPRNMETLVLALRVGCVHCENEMPFYEHLLELGRMRKTQVHFIALFPNSMKEIDSASDKQLSVIPIIPNVDMKSMGIRGTPTLLMIDGKGVVRTVWTGELNASQERSVIDAISAGT